MKKVFLSAGHGGSNPGAVAYGLKEKDINLNVLLGCKEELERHGVIVICSRTKDENDDVYEEVREANASGAIIAMSFHANAGGGDGSETFYHTSSSAGKRLAELCEKHTKAIGQNSRGVKSGNHLYFVNQTKMVAVLCECAFVDHNTDNDIIDTVAEQKKFGEAYAKAALEYLGIAYKTKTDTAKNTKPVLDTKGFKRGDNTLGVLTLKNLLILAKKANIITQGVDNNSSFGDGTEKAVNQVLKKLGYKQNGIAGENFIKKITAIIEMEVA